MFGMVRKNLGDARGWLVCLAVLALCASTVPGHQKVSLCLSADGHLDLRLAAQACRACPDAGCATDASADAASEDEAHPRLPFGGSCCYDIPLLVDAIGWLAPRAVDADSDAAAVTAVAATVAVAPDEPPSPFVADRPPPTDPPLPAHLAALGTVVLLL